MVIQEVAREQAKVANEEHGLGDRTSSIRFLLGRTHRILRIKDKKQHRPPTYPVITGVALALSGNTI